MRKEKKRTPPGFRGHHCGLPSKAIPVCRTGCPARVILEGGQSISREWSSQGPPEGSGGRFSGRRKLYFQGSTNGRGASRLGVPKQDTPHTASVYPRAPRFAIGSQQCGSKQQTPVGTRCVVRICSRGHIGKTRTLASRHVAQSAVQNGTYAPHTPSTLIVLSLLGAQSPVCLSVFPMRVAVSDRHVMMGGLPIWKDTSRPCHFGRR